MTFNSQKILVTGGLGYIGSHTVVQLLNKNANVVILDNLINSKKEVLDRIKSITSILPEFVEGDVRDRSLLKRLFLENRFDTVIHFAGLKSVSESVMTPTEYYDNNVVGSLTLFEEMLNVGVKKIIFSSSATVYGDPVSNPIPETAALKPLNPYGRSKLIVEDILRDLFVSNKSFCIAVLRYFNPVGAHESGLIGEDPNGIPNNLMPFITQVVSNRLNKLFIFGNNYPTFDGTGVRDYIHVDDLASGHIAAIEKLNPQGDFITLNLGTGQGISVLEMISTFKKVTGQEVPHEIVDRRPGDIASCYADSSLAKKLLGWYPKFDLERMCVDSLRWQTYDLDRNKL